MYLNKLWTIVVSGLTKLNQTCPDLIKLQKPERTIRFNNEEAFFPAKFKPKTNTPADA